MEVLLAKYKKDIINQQLQLKRVANIAIDLFAMTAVLSRVSRTIMREDATAEHEVRRPLMPMCVYSHCCFFVPQTKLTKAFFNDANERIARNLKAIYTNDKADVLTRQIAQDIFMHGAYLPPHPTGI